ncbi:DUF1178 family protein [bacterium]|nr:DUF1178 family protein [bacterium]
MIKYKLLCNDCELNFDSWFSSSSEYEKLKKKKLLICHNCNSEKVEKTLMAPRLISGKSKNDEKLDTQKYKKIKKKIKDYQKFIKDNFKYVGDNFAYEARSIHYNTKKPKKGIFGNASQKDIKELKEEGIDTQLIPWVDEKEN